MSNAERTIQFKRNVHDVYGEDIKLPDGDADPIGWLPTGDGRLMPKYPGVPMPLHKACVRALGHEKQGEPVKESDKKFRYRIQMLVAKAATKRKEKGQEIEHSGNIKLKADEIAEICKCAQAMWPTEIAGCVQNMLDPDTRLGDDKLFAGIGVNDEQAEEAPTPIIETAPKAPAPEGAAP